MLLFIDPQKNIAILWELRPCLIVVNTVSPEADRAAYVFVPSAAWDQTSKATGNECTGTSRHQGIRIILYKYKISSLIIPNKTLIFLSRRDLC